MKRVTIKGFSHAEVEEAGASFGFLKIPTKHTLIRAEGEELEVSDGYHSFNQLYDHRIELFIALCKSMNSHARDTAVAYEAIGPAWRSKLHADGSEYEGWFIMGIGKSPGEQISYHLPLSRWDDTAFAETLANAPAFDGHSSDDVLTRLKNL